MSPKKTITILDRPSNPINYELFYDRNINSVILFDGTNWRDLIGNVL